MSSFEDLLNKDGQIIYTNKGVSMMPVLRQDRDLMVIEKVDDKLNKLDVVLFKRKNGAYVLHRILKIYDDSYWIIGDNCISGETVKADQILGRLEAIIRDNKKISVNSFLYKLYSNTWCRFYHLRIFILRIKILIHSILRKVYRTFIKS